MSALGKVEREEFGHVGRLIVPTTERHRKASGRGFPATLGFNPVRHRHRLLVEFLLEFFDPRVEVIVRQHCLALGKHIPLTSDLLRRWFFQFDFFTIFGPPVSKFVRTNVAIAIIVHQRRADQLFRLLVA